MEALAGLQEQMKQAERRLTHADEARSELRAAHLRVSEEVIGLTVQVNTICRDLDEVQNQLRRVSKGLWAAASTFAILSLSLIATLIVEVLRVN